MGKTRGYSIKTSDFQKHCKAKATDMPVHFKNTVEVANALRGKTVKRAEAYLKNVIAKKECVPFKKFKGGVGRCAQAKQFKVTQGRWPLKSAKFFLDLLRNAVSNGEFNGLDIDRLYILHALVNQAPLNRRRTFRAHGHINPYMGHHCHMEICLVEKEQ